MSRIATVSISLSLAVMIISVAVLTGFKQQIKSKLTGFVSAIQIKNYDTNISFETVPIANYYDFIPQIKQIKGVKQVQQYATKGGIIKTDEEIQGVVLNGVATDFDWNFFKSYLVDGEIFEVNDSISTNKVLISQSLSSLLKLKTGDSFEIYFVQEPVRVRKFTVSGIYNTYFEEQDRSYVLCDIKHIQRLNGWTKNQISGFEVSLHDLNDLGEVYEQVDDLVSYINFEDGSRLIVYAVDEIFPEIFNWLNILDMNVWIILILMLAVSGFNMVSGLLIMLLEKSSMIGLFKSMGMLNFSLQKIFLYRSGIIVVKGVFWGNIIGIGCCLLQQHFGIFKLNPADYYFSVAPVQLQLLPILLLNACSFISVLLLQLLPSMFIAKISPDKTIRFN
jgi:lipoprotein-releasing system permease protein